MGEPSLFGKLAFLFFLTAASLFAGQYPYFRIIVSRILGSVPNLPFFHSIALGARTTGNANLARAHHEERTTLKCLHLKGSTTGRKTVEGNEGNHEHAGEDSE